MKKLLSVLSSTPQGGLRGGLLIFALLATSTLWAHDFEVNGIYYNYLDSNNVEVTYRGDCTICHDNEYSGSVTIPETVTHDGTTYRVTSIGGTAFAGCSDLKSVTIGNSVTSIGSAVFQECYSLSSVTIPNSVTSIGESAFSFCSALTSLTIPNSVTNIGDRAFTFCSALISLNIPNSVTNIGHQALSYCSALTSVIIGNSVTSIDSWAFYDCSSLTSINIPNSVTSIGANAFYNCSSLNSITIPNSVTSIGEYAFYNCSGLTLVTIGDGLTSIGARAFDYCKNIEEIYCYPITPPAVESSSFCNYSKATLYVPCDSKEVYEQHPIFGKFEKIKGIEGCGEYVTTHIYDTICQGDVYEFGEYLCDTTGTYTAFIDLVPTYLHLTVLPSSIDTITVEAYDSYEWHGKVYTESGTYIYEEHCYQEILQLTIIDTPTPPSAIQDDIYYADTICEGEIYVWMGMEFTETGTYTYTYEEIVEDKDYIYLHILYLTVLPLETIEYEMIAYDSYEWHGVVYTESGTYIYEEHCYQEILQLTIIDTPTPPEPEIPTEGIGVFSIGEGKAVTFSRGNLQYTQSTQTWSFAENQYDYLGTANISNGALADKIDLFGWSASNTTAPFGVSTSTDWENGYSGSFIDWGTNKIGNDAPNTWRTLTRDEWEYLRYNRTNADNLVGVAQVNGVNGLIFLPDNWTCPSGVTFKSGFHSNDGVDYYAAYQTFTAEQWSKLEAAGAVFLPAAGYRYGSFVSDVQYYGYYWSATELGSYYAYILDFYSDEAGMGYSYRYDGHAVRLIKDVNSTTPEPPVEPQDTTIYSPTEGIGVFSIGEGKTVTFSLGNLQYHPANDEWRFAENQTDYIGSANSNISATYSGWLDLFGWGTGNAPTKSSTDYSDYQTFVDWGTNKIGNDASNTWRTLTYDEWDYLRYNRTNANDLCGVAQVNGVNGLIFLPDNWTCPAGVAFKSGFYNSYGVDYYAAYQTFTAEQWSKMEAAGAIFLPAASRRYGSDVGSVQFDGYYWSATEDDDDSNRAYYLYFSTTRAGRSSGTRDGGRSVRLVKDISSTTPEPPVEPQDTTIYHPTEYATICEGTTFVWMGMEFTEIGTYTYEEIIEDENYIYHYIHTLELQVIAPPEPDTIVVEAYDSYEWHGVVYTESGTYIYEEHCYQEILELTIIPSEDKEYVYEHHNYLVCDADIFVDPITGSTHVISSLIPFSLTWSDTIIGTNIDTIHTFNITPIVAPEPLTEDILYAIGAVPELVAGEMVNTMGTTEPIMWYYQMNDKDDIADVIGVEWVAGHDVVLNTEQTTHTMVLEVWDECYNTRSMKFTFPVSKKDSEPQDTTIYISSEDVTICEGIKFVWMGMEYTEEGIYTYEEIVVEDDYIYHYIYTLHLMVLPPTLDMYEVTAYDSYEWHGVVYTESGVYTYSDPYNPCVIEELHLTIIDTPTIPTEYATICEGETYIWRGKQITEAGTYIYEEIVEDEDYTYHHTYTLELTVLPYETIEYEVEAYDSYVWHGIVYTESGTYTYQYECITEVLYLTIIPSEDNQGEVVVEPSTNSVTITWQKEDDADTYIIVIKQGDKVVCTLIFDAEGNLVSVNYLPCRESNKHGIQHAGLTSDSFQYTITGLTPSTDYTYTVTATDDSDNTISSYSGEFTTHHATSVENTSSQSPTSDCQKILYEDHIYILRDGKIYSIMGQEM